MNVPARVAVIGAGEIGSGWAALFAAFGAEVRVVDPGRLAISRANAALDCARRIGVGDGGRAGSIRVSRSLELALDGASWIQESLPEHDALKRGALEALDAFVAPDAIIASSTSTLLADSLARDRPYADRFLIAHPLQPVYAVPLVELCAGARTAPATVDRAAATLRLLGREPVIVRLPVAGLVANRLTAALLREAFDLVSSGAIDADGLDLVVRRGLATGWIAAGALGTEAIGAGDGGLTAFVERFADPLAELWGSLARWTELDDTRRRALLFALAAMEKTPVAGDECGWAERLARVARAADQGSDESE
ncbi:MAG: 3-hydroxyacyl-CoA dehydrogenase NAD-binding domain-containing protein [Gemmatimonadaceae bacterium]